MIRDTVVLFLFITIVFNKHSGVVECWTTIKAKHIVAKNQCKLFGLL